MLIANQWRWDTSNFLPFSHWPNGIEGEPVSHLDEEDDNTFVELGDYSPLPDTVFQLDDQHVMFLEEQEKEEEGEVERLVTLVYKHDC
jgi:hypothetical protein